MITAILCKAARNLRNVAFQPVCLGYGRTSLLSNDSTSLMTGTKGMIRSMGRAAKLSVTCKLTQLPEDICHALRECGRPCVEPAVIVHGQYRT